MTRQRILIVLAVLALVIGAATVSWIAGSSIQSPAEAAARTAPPTPAPILVPVETRVLTADVVTRGTARYGAPQTVLTIRSALKQGAAIVTSLPDRGSLVDEGSMLLTVSGRPLFALQGEVPAYRDLTPGTSGNDVRQLEIALERMGYDSGPADGIYDEATGAAVAAWYAAEGWQPFAATAEEQAVVNMLEQELAVATSEQLAAADEAAAAPLKVQAVRAEVEAANKAAAAAESVAASAAEREAQRAATVATALTGEVRIQAAVNAQAAAEHALQLTSGRVERLTAELEAAQRNAGAKVPVDEIIFLPTLPVRIEEAHVNVGHEATGAIVTLTNDQLVIDSSLPLEEAPLVRPGMSVAIDEPDLGIEATGVVARVAASPGTNGVDGFHVYFETIVNETPTELDGFSLRLTIPVESTGDAVPVVPLSALFLAADGTTRVQVARDGKLVFAEVIPGLSADGFVEVTAVNDELLPGQLVAVGYEE